jgi:hypothetical protein
VKSLAPLNDYYTKTLADVGQSRAFRSLPVNEKFFVGRLGMLLKDQYGAEGLGIVGRVLEWPFPLIQETALNEKAAFDNLKLQAITFLPAVFQALKNVNPDKNLGAIVVIYLKLWNALLKAFLTVDPKSFQGNASLPLFGLSKNTEFLKAFSENPDSKLELDVKVDNFIHINVEMPKLSAAAALGVQGVFAASAPAPAAPSATGGAQKSPSSL